MDEGVPPAHRDAPASSSRESASEPRVKVVSDSGKRSVYTHFPKRLRDLQANQDYKGSMQKTH